MRWCRSNNKIKGKKIIGVLFSVLVLFAFFAKNCGPLERGEEEIVPTQPTQPTQCPPVSYSNDIYPMLVQKCSACHTGGNEPSLSGNKDADYTKISRYAKEVEGEESKLLLKASGKVTHGGGAVIPEGSEEYIKLKCWIEAGAPKN